MDKYQNSRISLNSTYPITNRPINPGPLYTMCDSKSQQQGPQLLMNSASVGTATQFEFVPARQFTTNFPASLPIEMGTIFNTVRTFVISLLTPQVDVNTNSTCATTDRAEIRKCKSTPNIYMDSMSDRKCSDEFEKNSFDVTDGEMLAKLSASTKSFSDYNLPTSTVKNRTKSPDITRKMDLNVSEEPHPERTKENELEMAASILKSLFSQVPVAQPQSLIEDTEIIFVQQRKHCKQMPKVPTKPRSQCVDGKRTTKGSTKKKYTKKSIKSGKNKKEKERHELTQNIHEDVETETETMSPDEFEEPLISETKTSPIKSFGKVVSEEVSFSEDDFPAMSEYSAPNSRNNSKCKQTWELPRLSHCFASFKGRKQRQTSECDSEDSFIVFDRDDKTIPSVESNQSICDRIRSTLSESSDDDFICFETSDIDDDNEDCDERFASDSECESEVDDVISIGSDQLDSGFTEKKVRFNLTPAVHVLRTWSFAYRQARKGQWEQNGRDRVRFQNRIKGLESTLLPVLDSDHRQKIFCDRFLSDADKDICDSAIEK